MTAPHCYACRTCAAGREIGDARLITRVIRLANWSFSQSFGPFGAFGWAVKRSVVPVRQAVAFIGGREGGGGSDWCTEQKCVQGVVFVYCGRGRVFGRERGMLRAYAADEHPF